VAIRILHISDLHFGRAFRDSDRSLRDRLLQRGDMRGHDFQLISSLSAKVHRLARQGGPFDLALVTGDVSTDGASKSLGNAAKLLLEDEIFTSSPGHFIVNGLGLAVNSVIAIPGNHDRYKSIPFQLDFGNFESFFLKQWKGYPFVVAYSKYESGKDECPVLLFVFDSSAVNNPPFGLKPHQLISRGYIDDAACEWLEIKTHKIRMDGLVPELDGKTLQVDFDRCVKIVLLHHHPVEFPDIKAPALLEAEKVAQRRHQITTKIKDQWSTLLNKERFLEACFASGIDLVLFGHQHLFLHRELTEDMKEITSAQILTRSIHFCGCPTTLQWAESEIGFLVYRIEWSRFAVDYFGWNEEEQKFERNPSRSGIFPFRRGRKAEDV